MPANLRLAHPVRDVQGNGTVARIRVVLAEDHLTMRRSLRLLLDAEPSVEVVGEAADLPNAIRQVHDRHPDVLILDLRMPHGEGLETIRTLRSDAPETQIVVLSMERSRSLAKRVGDAGAIGFVLKDTADVELAEAVTCAVAQRAYTSPRVGPAR